MARYRAISEMARAKLFVANEPVSGDTMDEEKFTVGC